MNTIQKPIKRTRIRQIVGKEYFITKRKFNWWFGGTKWAKKAKTNIEGHSVFKHKSMILRPLKDVEMYLQENKRTNLKLAIAHVNQVVLRQGETMSLWKLIGRPTASKGYLEGLVLKQGQIDKGVGGGLCQLGNLLFWIFAHSPLTIVERYRHGFDVFPDVNRKVPFGAGATLSYNYIDLQVQNNESGDFQLKLWMDDEYLYGELISNEPLDKKYHVEERNHKMEQQMWGGYSRHNQIVRIETDIEQNRQESLLVENHAILMYNPFLTS